MKKIILFMAVFFLFGISANASDVYYTNYKGLSLTKEEYDFFSKVYYEGYQDFMTVNDYNLFEKEYMNVQNVDIVINDYSYSRATAITQNGRTLKIAKVSSNNNYSTIAITANWNANPAVRSNDLIGAYLDGVSLSGTVTTRLTIGTSSNYYNPNIINVRGFGCTIPLSGNDLPKITQTFKVSNGGTVYASYQHAIRAVSLANSQSYSIDRYGLGGVFKFSNASVALNYDNANGVNISV